MGTTTIQPIDASAGVPQYSAQNERQGFAALMGGGSGRQLGARPGLRLGTPSNLITVTSTTWTAGVEFAAILDPAYSATQGPYRYAYSPSPSADSGSVTPADPTYPRKDIIVIRVDDASAGDPSGARQAPLVYRAGTAVSMTPTAPTLNAREFLVGTITMPQVGAGSPTFTLNPQYFVAAGAPQPVFSQSERDALTAYDGLMAQRMDLPGRPIDTYNGTSWQLPPQGQIAAAAYSSGTGNIAYNFLAIIADVTTPTVAAGRKLRITLETDANMSASAGICAIGLKNGGTTGADNGNAIRNCAVSYQSATSTESSDLTFHYTTIAAGAQRFYAISTAVLPSGATVNYPANARRITVYDDGPA